MLFDKTNHLRRGTPGGEIGLTAREMKIRSSTLTVGLHTEGESATPVRLWQDGKHFTNHGEI